MLTALVRGAGDLASGAALSLHRAGFSVVMTEISEPLAIRRTVSFAEAVYDGEQVVEGVRAVRADREDIPALLGAGTIAVLVDPEASVRGLLSPEVLVDGIMAKENRGTSRGQAPIVIALGPGFRAGTDADAVIETERGHELGRVIRDGGAREDTGVPGEIGGAAGLRVLRAPAAGPVVCLRRIGDLVTEGEAVMSVGGEVVPSPLAGCLRGMIRAGISVPRGIKVGDVDPRGDPRLCLLVSDKARAVGRGVLEAVLLIGREKGVLGVSRLGGRP
jgi:xanthine dehydrogenase accessory factor